MQRFDITSCEVKETPFEYNGTRWVNVRISCGEQITDYEFRDYNDYYTERENGKQHRLHME